MAADYTYSANPVEELKEAAEAANTATTHRTNDGTPSSVLTPTYVGEEVLDTTNTVWYKSTGLTDTDWVAINV